MSAANLAAHAAAAEALATTSRLNWWRAYAYQRRLLLAVFDRMATTVTVKGVA